MKMHNDQKLPEGIEENVPFDGSLLKDKGFTAGRTYMIGPMMSVRPLIIFPNQDEDACFEDAHYTYTLIRGDHTILPLESYFSPEVDPMEMDWMAGDERRG